MFSSSTHRLADAVGWALRCTDPCGYLCTAISRSVKKPAERRREWGLLEGHDAHKETHATRVQIASSREHEHSVEGVGNGLWLQSTNRDWLVQAQSRYSLVERSIIKFSMKWESRTVQIFMAEVWIVSTTAFLSNAEFRSPEFKPVILGNDLYLI